MGPKLWGKKGKETEYTLRAIPIGGFCQMAGEDMEDDELKKIPKNKRLQSKTVWQRFLIMFFGAGNNFISAILILFFMALIWGGASMSPKITEVTKDYPAAKAGISNFTQWLATHFAGTGIRCNAIAPGFLVSNQNRALLFNEDGTPTPRAGKILNGTPMGRFAESEELLGGMFFLTDDKAASAITGVVLPIDCGFAAYSGV